MDVVALQRDDLLRGLDCCRLIEPDYFDAARRRLQGLTRIDERAVAEWFLVKHRHLCTRCQRVVEHTGLEATRDGDLQSHTCCAADVRKPLTEILEHV